MEDLTPDKIATWLKSVLGQQVAVCATAALGDSSEGRRQKKLGYGTPIRIEYESAAAERKTAEERKAGETK